ncbi:hypothetical protein B484DRAFT_479482 [Ochromonadaceae sp. CCMP2298]|nr:hypothetical protein B484DRAFT_479482 [Ochromonadaceae sp. CCMP2298]|mmetsp:Transcript_16474/g.36495  ORF Transcript_16474/g.36495 Transcript_16474/m.36495 type:complete len:312 (+) Transcript_16474:208-1143(+)
MAILWKTVCGIILLMALYVQSSDRGLLVIPGLGRRDRLETVLWNLRLLEQNGFRSGHVHWDCVVYIYAPREDRSFWESPMQLLYDLCSVIEVPNQLVTQNLHMVQPPLLVYQYISVLLDDCKITRGFDLDGMVRVMAANNLTVASPMIMGANKGGGQKFRNIMQTPAQPSTEGYISSFVEIFVWVMTLPAYTALWDLLLPAVNPYAWGYDFWYSGYAATHVRGHKMGIVSTMGVKHEQGDLLGRTDNADVKVKWNAVLAQERHYKMYKGVDLAYYRQHLDIANTSWNGAVKGLLPPCPECWTRSAGSRPPI